MEPMTSSPRHDEFYGPSPGGSPKSGSPATVSAAEASRGSWVNRLQLLEMEKRNLNSKLGVLQDNIINEPVQQIAHHSEGQQPNNINKFEHVYLDGFNQKKQPQSQEQLRWPQEQTVQLNVGVLEQLQQELRETKKKLQELQQHVTELETKVDRKARPSPQKRVRIRNLKLQQETLDETSAAGAQVWSSSASSSISKGGDNTSTMSSCSSPHDLRIPV